MSWQAILALLFLVLPGIAKRIELIYSVEYVSNYIEISVQSTGPLNNFQVSKKKLHTDMIWQDIYLCRCLILELLGLIL